MSRSNDENRNNYCGYTNHYSMGAYFHHNSCFGKRHKKMKILWQKYYDKLFCQYLTKVLTFWDENHPIMTKKKKLWLFVII